MRHVLTTTLSLALLSTVSFAATPPQTSSTTGQAAQNVPQELQQKLTDQGFTDVKVVPDSFLVSAKDKQGYPVTMLIGPNSLTVFTMIQDHRQAKGEHAKQ